MQIDSLDAGFRDSSNAIFFARFLWFIAMQMGERRFSGGGRLQLRLEIAVNGFNAVWLDEVDVLARVQRVAGHVQRNNRAVLHLLLLGGVL